VVRVRSIRVIPLSLDHNEAQPTKTREKGRHKKLNKAFALYGSSQKERTVAVQIIHFSGRFHTLPVQNAVSVTDFPFRDLTFCHNS